MENLDIIILTAVLVTLFIVFSIWTYKELSSFDKEINIKDTSPRANLIKFMQTLFEEDISIKDKKVIYKVVNRTISDMESDGVYFTKDIKEKLKEYRLSANQISN